jgi:hypothetical protein
MKALICQVLGVSFLIFSLGVQAQDTNPFELAPRGERPDTGNLAVERMNTQEPENPFELGQSGVSESVGPEAAIPAPLQGSQLKRGAEYGIVLVIVVFFALLMHFYREALVVSIRALLQDGAFTQLYRERESLSNVPFRLFYIFFLLNGGIFSYHLIPYMGMQPAGNGLLIVAGLSIGLFGLYFYKRTLLRLLMILFPGERGMSLYHFTIILFGTAFGPLLFVFNLLHPFLPDYTLTPLLLVLAIPAFLLVLLRLIRSGAITARFFLKHKFHFFLYICTVEIAPVLVFVKLAQLAVASPIGTFQ